MVILVMNSDEIEAEGRYLSLLRSTLGDTVFFSIWFLLSTKGWDYLQLRGQCLNFFNFLSKWVSESIIFVKWYRSEEFFSLEEGWKFCTQSKALDEKCWWNSSRRKRILQMFREMKSYLSCYRGCLHALAIYQRLIATASVSFFKN